MTCWVSFSWSRLGRRSVCCLMALASWRRDRSRCFVKLTGRSFLLRSVDCTLALRACFGVVHLHAPIRLGGQRPGLTGVLLAVGSRFVAFRSVVTGPLRSSVPSRPASWHLNGSRCRETVRSLCVVAGVLGLSLPPLPSAASLRPCITSACRRWPLCRDGSCLPAVVAALPLYACGLLCHHEACFRFGLGHF